MPRLIVGILIAAAAMFVIGGVFYASGIQNLAFRDLDNARAAAVQQNLAQNLGTSTGTYTVPGTSTAEQTAMYGKGPIATIRYNYRGFPAFSASALLLGFVLDVVIAALIGLGFAGLAGVQRSGARERLAVAFAIAASAYIHMLDPVFLHLDWWNSVYRFVADALALGVGGVIVARWAEPRRTAEAAPR